MMSCLVCRFLHFCRRNFWPFVFAVVKQIISFNSIKKSVKSKNIAEGMNFRLTCSANFSMNAVNKTYTRRRGNDILTSKIIHNFSMNAVNVTYTWRHIRGKNSNNLTESKRINSAELLMYNISRDEAGTYECLASTSRMNMSITANITVVVTVMCKYDFFWYLKLVPQKYHSGLPGIPSGAL